MDFIKDLSEAWSQRLRSPFIGSIAISFFAINWQPIWYLVFATRPVRQKFLYFDANTSIVSLAILPIAFGVAIALASPWLRTLGAWWAQRPNGKMKKIQHNAAHQLKMLEIETELVRVEAEANLQATKERAKIDAAKRLEEAAQIGGQQLIDEIEDERRVTETKKEVPAAEMDVSELAVDFLQRISHDNSGIFYLSEHDGKYSITQSGNKKSISDRAHYLEIVAAIEELRAKGLLERQENAISSTGYRFLYDLEKTNKSNSSEKTS